MLDKKTRLNETIRNQIVVNALKSSGYFAEGKQLVEDRAAFAVKVHALVLSNAGLTEEGLDKEWLCVSENGNDYIYSSDNKNNWMRVNLAGITADLCFNGAESTHYSTHLGDSWGEKSIQKWVPRNRPNIADQILKDEFMGLAARQQANEDKKASIDSTVRAVLRSVATVGKLLEAWPEAVELLPDEIVQTTKTGLAIIPENLNSLVGIPSPK